MIHLEQSVYLAIMERFEKRERKRAEKKDLTIEKGRMVKRLLFLTPAFAPLALALCAFDTQPLPLWRSCFVHARYPKDMP